MAENEPNAPFIHNNPSERVRKFLKENPEADWRICLNFLLDNWPQVVAGEVQYVIEGGTAVKLLFPQRGKPADVDVISRSEEMEEEFQGASKKLDVKRIEFWLAVRVWPHNLRYFDSEKAEFLFTHTREVEFMGRELLVLNEIALAASKEMPYSGSRSKRPKDITDLELLRQDPLEVEKLINRIKSTRVDTQFNF